MKKLIHFLSFLLALMVANYTIAQTMIGVRGGVNFASFSEDVFTPVFEDADMGFMVGVDVAVFGKIALTDAFSVQPEFHWTQKGIKSTMTTQDNMDVEMTLRYNYLELPVLARADFGTETVSFNIFAGPSAGYALDGKYIGKNVPFGGESPSSGDFEEELEWDTEFGDNGIKDNRWDFSAVAGLGVEYDLGSVKILLDSRYTYDFNDFVKYEETPDPEPDKFYHRGIIVSAGLAIPLVK
jgi:hypothetical protein